MSPKNDNTIKLNDGRILGYAEYGDPKGKPMFFFHGWPSSRLHAVRFDKVAKKLKARLISPDRPGYGLSDFQKNRKLTDYPDDILELADHLKIKKFAVVGVSGGGPYAAVCAYKIPEKITKVGVVVGVAPTNIKNAFNGMSLLSKFGWANFSRLPGLRQFSGLIWWLQVNFAPNINGFGFRARVDRAFFSEEFRRQTNEMLKESFKQGFRGPAWDLKIYTSDWGFKLNKIKSKVYLWYGDADKNVSLNMGKYYASQIPNSKLIVYPGEGHFVQITHAQDILSQLI